MACRSVSFTTAQADYPLVPCTANQTLSLYKVSVYCSNANTVNTLATLAFGAAGGNDRETITGHDGIDAGSGFVEAMDRRSPIGEGHAGQPILFTCGTPSTGSIRVNISYDIHAVR